MADKGNKNRKYGRNKMSCKVYKDRGVREANKKRKMKRHIKRFPKDEQAIKRARELYLSKDATDTDVLAWACPFLV